MEASKEGEAPEPAPESLPTETAEGKPKRTMLLAVIVVVILIIAALGAAFGLGLFGKKKAENKPPTAGAVATTVTTININDTVSFNSTSTDPDGYIANCTWYFGDGTTGYGNTTSHKYIYGGAYLVELVVTDDKGATANTESSMIKVFVGLWDPIAWSQIGTTDPVTGKTVYLNSITNTTAPYATMLSDQSIVQEKTIVAFNMTGSYAFANWHLLVPSDPNSSAIDKGWQCIHSVTMDYGDGATVDTVTPAEFMTSSHNYTTPGHYASKLTVTSNYSVSTIVIITIHVLTTAPPTIGLKNPDAFVEATIGEPDYLDPATDYETAGGEVLQNTYETLVWYNGASATDLVPMLAKEIPTFANGLISPDGMNYTFNLKTGIKFHSGDTMNSTDVAYSVQRLIRIHDPFGPSWMVEQVMTNYLSSYIGTDLGTYKGDMSPPYWVLNAIGGTADSYVITELDNQNVSEAAVTVVNDTAVNMRLTHAYPGFLSICAFNAMSVVCKAYVEAHPNTGDTVGVSNGNHNTWMDSHEDGTGPYMLVSWDVGSKIHCTRFANYHGTAPALKDVYILKANDVNTRILMLQGGDVDIGAIPITYQALFTGSSYRITKGLPTYDIDIVGFNQKINTTAAAVYGGNVPQTFFSDPLVRSAFVHLMNVPLFIQNVEMGNAIQPNGPIPKGMFGYNASQPLQAYNIAAAKGDLMNATNPATGNSWWDDGFTIALLYNAGNTIREQGCQYLKAGIESLGSKFHATVNTLDWPTYLRQSRLKPNPLPVMFIGWAPDYNDPDDYVAPFMYSGGTYPLSLHYANASIDENVTLAAAEGNLTVRQGYYDNITSLAYHDNAYIWLMQPNVFHIERYWLKGYYFNPMYSLYYWPQFSKS